MRRPFCKATILRCTLLVLIRITLFSGSDGAEAQPSRKPTEHPNSLPLANLRPEHPRLWFNQDNLQLLRARWSDPNYSGIVGSYSGNGAISAALRYLATGNKIDAQTAISAAMNYGNSGGEGERKAAWCDVPAIVFDWCYDQLTSSQKSSLVSKISMRRDNYQKDKHLADYFSWHEIHRWMPAYISAVLAIEGEPGASSRLQEAQNMLQNWQESGDEAVGDGGYRTYFYQGSYQCLSPLLYTLATDLDLFSRSNFVRNFTSWVLRRLNQSGNRYTRGPADDGADEKGYTKFNENAEIFYVIASRLNNPLAQWLGDKLRDGGRFNNWESPDAFLSFIYYNPSRSGLSPKQLNEPLVKYFDKIGMVNFRSGWNYAPTTTNDIVAWFYNGPKDGHSGAAQNHFTIWRGNDDLLILGGNYFGVPSNYQSRYYGTSLPRNVLLFSPSWSNKPDYDGGQVNAFYAPQRYPNSAAVKPNWAGPRYRGEITYFQRQPDYTIVTGDAGIAYYDDLVYASDGSKYYLRDFVYIKPDLFIVRDRFAGTDIANIRFLLHSRQKPIFSGATTVVRGSSNAGIIEGSGNAFEIVRGESKLSVDVLWPNQAKLRFIGGRGYEGWANGSNSDPAVDGNPVHVNDPGRLQLAYDQWRTEIEVSPAQANGNLITVFFVSANQSNLEQPILRLKDDGNEKSVSITYKGRSLDVVFPKNGTPFVKGSTVDNQPPSSPKNLRVSQ